MNYETVLRDLNYCLLLHFWWVRDIPLSFWTTNQTEVLLLIETAKYLLLFYQLLQLVKAYYSTGRCWNKSI